MQVPKHASLNTYIIRFKSYYFLCEKRKMEENVDRRISSLYKEAGHSEGR